MFGDRWMGLTRTAVAAAVAVVVAAPALAQNTTAGIAGVVTGADGKPLAGATVTIVHVDSRSSNTVTTDAQGRYAARGLRAGGPYTITITQSGLVQKREGVVLALAETFALDAQLGASTQTVTITGRADAAAFNRNNMGAGTSLGSRELGSFASIQRNLQDYARTDPRLAQTDKERGQISAAGQNIRYNSITLDGVTTNDTFGLEDNNLPTAKQPISIDAIQSVQINLSNYDVTQKGYTGANINAVTKSGTNEFKGSLYYVWRDESLAGKRYNRITDSYFDPAPFEQSTKGFTLGGPIIKDKLFFFGSYEEFKGPPATGLPAFGPLGSGLTNVGISQSSIDSALAISRDVWGINGGTATTPGALDLEVKDTLLKLDWNISDAHRASVRYAKTEQTEPFIVGFSTTGLSTSSYWYNQTKEIESLVGQWFADWTPDISTELKVSRRDYASRPTPFTGDALPQIGLRFSGALPAGTPAGVSANNRFLNLGTERSRHFNVLETQTDDIYAGGTWNLGVHELKFGIDYAKNEVFNAFLQDTNGQYTFGCEPGTYTFGTFTSCNDMTAQQRELATLENYRKGLPSFYQVQAPQAGKTLADGAGAWSMVNTGVFVQDSWKISKDFSLMLGVRLDQQDVPTPPQRNAAAAAAPVQGTVVGGVYTRATGGFGLDNTVTLDGKDLVQPRIGFNWNLGSPERRIQLRGGAGLFQGTAANVWLSNPFSNTGVAVASLSCADFTACSRANNGGQVIFSPDPTKQPTLTGTPPAANVDFLSPGLEQPSVWKANLALEAELPALPVVGQLVASAEWLHTRTNTGIYYQHLNLGAPTATGSDGRQLFYRSEGYNVNCWNASTGNAITNGACVTPTGQSRTRALSNRSFNNVYLAKETSEGEGNAVTLSISKPASSGFGWSLAYTATAAKEVSPLTSSTSGSNWGNRNIFNPNEEVLQNSNYLIKDRFTASATWAKAFFGNYRTSVGMFYEGRRGKPYSWTYINDLNGDGQGGNDLMYIPSAPGSGEVVFRGGADEERRFWEVVNAHEPLRDARGGVVGRNDNYAPWVNNIDVRFSQELPGFIKGHKASFTFDILNFGNLLNKKWGRIDEINFPSARSFVNYNGLDSQGRYIYSMGTVEDLRTVQDKGESQWAVQLTLRYEF